jgi:glutathione transport system substrate-binding protein
MYKKVLAMIMVSALTVSLAACGTKENKNESAGSNDGTVSSESTADGELSKATNQDAKSADNDLVIAIDGSISSLDPANIPDTNSIAVTRSMYETLVRFNEEQELEGLLAESWEISEDSLTYTFHLRKGIKFSDGTDFNSAAIKANYDRTTNADNKLRQRKTFIVANQDGTERARVANIETPDDYTIVFTLSEAWAPFINRLTQFCIISPAALEQYGNDIMYHPTGTGPFVLEEWTEGDHTTLKRNEGYWGEKPGVDTATIKEVPEAGSRTAMLQTGEADFIYPTTSDQLDTIKNLDDVNVRTSDSNIMRYVTLNTSLPELQDVKVRQAINYAIDKDAYVTLMYSGYAKPATSVVPSIIDGYKEQEAYDYNIEKAKELMKEAGYEDGFKLTLWGENTTQEVKGMTFIKQQLEQIGIEVEVLPTEPATLGDKIYVDKEEAEINMWYVNWSASDFTMDGSVRNILYSTMCPPTSANTAYYENAEFDKLLDEGVHTADVDSQKAVYEQAQKLVWEDAPWIFLGNDQIIYSTKSYLSGVYIAPDGAFNFSKAVLAQ